MCDPVFIWKGLGQLNGPRVISESIESNETRVESKMLFAAKEQVELDENCDLRMTIDPRVEIILEVDSAPELEKQSV